MFLALLLMAGYINVMFVEVVAVMSLLMGIVRYFSHTTIYYKTNEGEVLEWAFSVREGPILEASTNQSLFLDQLNSPTPFTLLLLLLVPITLLFPKKTLSPPRLVVIKKSSLSTRSKCISFLL